MGEKIESYRLQSSSYPYQISIDTQFSDMDLAGHINNLALARFYEACRARAMMVLFDNPRLYQETDYSTVVAEYTIRFLAESHFPEPVLATLGMHHIGKSSFHLHQALFQKGQCVGVCDVVMVLFKDGKPCPIPGHFLPHFEGMRMKKKGTDK